MDSVVGVINLINEKPFLKELTYNRCLASVPFAGRYRMIDFTLSNFIHAQVKSVAVFTKEKYRSIMDHLGSGKEWDLDRHSGGLFILPPIHPDQKIKGDLQQFYDHIEFFQRSIADTVIITPGHHVCKIDFNDIILQHRHHKADITVIYKKYDGTPALKPIYHGCTVNQAGEVVDIDLYTFPKNDHDICLETYVINKYVLIELIKKCVENDEYDFLKDMVKANLNKLKVMGYQFKGSMPFIHSIESFHAGNMAFLNREYADSFLDNEWTVFTKIKHEAPAKYSSTSTVSNSLIANGCEIEGTVENSIIFRGVKVKKGATVKNSIIMQKSEIGEGAYLDHVITDKQVMITNDRVVKGDEQPIVIKKAEML
ncbi:glucose-1-phosphate adenylyltransferase subunit GlgD [Bacillus sp. FJAT-49736]|uniref:glucose-1-phosphate adenylyltransferase subunit GlgD n=1 Tax=Bacillus sp. FJAT-49736 TaxID=2833582 RepID=UPI001BCA4F24|nr:glucose-1-phosphate adenylyltransferase subunit GlgD [Bacillus sp. FJAT-49736]MBS4173066.1 glucose-1-phosphate adenylyltransferase subunit GlgD [Bacillus sp. FJAT-49736]